MWIKNIIDKIPPETNISLSIKLLLLIDMKMSPEKAAIKAIIFKTRLNSLLVGFTNDIVFASDVLSSFFLITKSLIVFMFLIVSANIISIIHKFLFIFIMLYINYIYEIHIASTRNIP